MTRATRDAGPPWTALSWSRFLEEQLECPVEVVFGRSRTTPVQVRPIQLGRADGLRIRMHSMFVDAPRDVGEGVAKWVRSGKRARRACATLDAWIHESLETLPPRKATRRPALEPSGVHYDLTNLAAPLYVDCFASDFAEGQTFPALGWGRRGRSRSRHSLRLGSYEREGHEVRIHPVLDQPGVPEWFVRYVLFHEILHAALPAQQGTGSLVIHHGPQFRRREHAYVDYARALQWEEKNLPRLIRSARRGTPMPVPKLKARVIAALQRELF